MKLQELATHLLNLDPQKNPGRLAFYHYIKNFRHLDEALSPEILRGFYHRAMQFPQWQVAPNELGQAVADDLDRILARHGLGEAFKDFRHAHQVQWIDLKHMSDFRAVIAEENALLIKNGEDIKAIETQNGEVIRIRLNRQKNFVRVEVKTKFSYIEGNRVQTVQPVTELIYDQDLELMRGAVQVLRLSPSKYARFYMEDDQVVGLILQGASFAKTDTLRGALDRGADTFWTPDKISEIFWALKDIEKHFINPVTDRHYIGIIADLESGIHALNGAHPNRELIASEALQKAEVYQDRVMKDDKVLNNLVATLKYQISRGGQVPYPGIGGPQSPLRTAQALSQNPARPTARVNWIKPDREL